MRFLIDADLPRRTAVAIRAAGHEAYDVRDIGLGTARDAVIAAHAKREGLCLVTGDFDFADIRNYPPNEYAGIVVIQGPANATAAVFVELVERFLRDQAVLGRLQGRLAIVDSNRIRLRPA